VVLALGSDWVGDGQKGGRKRGRKKGVWRCGRAIPWLLWRMGRADDQRGEKQRRAGWGVQGYGRRAKHALLFNLASGTDQSCCLPSLPIPEPFLSGGRFLVINNRGSCTLQLTTSGFSLVRLSQIHGVHRQTEYDLYEPESVFLKELEDMEQDWMYVTSLTGFPIPTCIRRAFGLRIGFTNALRCSYFSKNLDPTSNRTCILPILGECLLLTTRGLDFKILGFN